MAISWLWPNFLISFFLTFARIFFLLLSKKTQSRAKSWRVPVHLARNCFPAALDSARVLHCNCGTKCTQTRRENKWRNYSMSLTKGVNWRRVNWTWRRKKNSFLHTSQGLEEWHWTIRGLRDVFNTSRGFFLVKNHLAVRRGFVLRFSISKVLSEEENWRRLEEEEEEFYLNLNDKRCCPFDFYLPVSESINVAYDFSLLSIVCLLLCCAFPLALWSSMTRCERCFRFNNQQAPRHAVGGFGVSC